MKFINPVGRTPSSTIQPMACMCSGNLFATGKGTDSCINCGCACGSSGQYRSGNRLDALVTPRAS
jgi:putative bacteriocin precursor